MRSSCNGMIGTAVVCEKFTTVVTSLVVEGKFCNVQWHVLPILQYK